MGGWLGELAGWVGEDDEDSDDDSGFDMSMLVLLTAMQSQAPGSAMGANAMMPLLMMDGSGSNQELIMFMSMMNNQQC